MRTKDDKSATIIGQLYVSLDGWAYVIVIDNSIRFESSGRGKKKRERERKVCKMRRGGMDKF